jgi:molybdopterin synthase sulfur carrier subunit
MPRPHLHPMHVTVKVFATLKRYLPADRADQPFDLEVADGATLADVVRLIGLPEAEVKVTFVNGRTEELSHALREGDEVGIFPPLGGG